MTVAPHTYYTAEYPMGVEGQTFDVKSLRYAYGKHEDVRCLAADCVGFANAAGGIILLGVEDGWDEPPEHQHVPDEIADQLRKRILQITVNVSLAVSKHAARNGSEYLAIRVVRNEQSIAATSDGRYFIRISDETRRLLPDDLGRLMTEKQTFNWELLTASNIPAHACDEGKRRDFVERIRASDRVSDFIRSKADDELLDHYLFVRSAVLTNLGILWIGRREDRAALSSPPEIQCIKYDERGRKVRKQVWNDYECNPLELIEAVWREVPDWREYYELPDGLFRKTIPQYDEVVVRELLANAIAHRPYTQRGDIFLNLHPDRLEVHNPGLLPIGVTPNNILHASSKRNPHLAKVLYDLNLMEGEGSGFDRMYEVLLSSGRPAPQVEQGDDRVVVTVWKQIARPEIINFIAKADQTFSLTQKELITLGLLAQRELLTARDLVRLLDLSRADDLRHWLGRLKECGIVNARGRTQATEYFIETTVLRTLKFQGNTTLQSIEKHRLRELILHDLEIYRRASIGEIHHRIGTEIPRRRIRQVLSVLVGERQIGRSGVKRGTVYFLTK
jgi:ATP-dependent DNA helicase RecG